MNQVSKPVSNKIAIVFDFDETLIPEDSLKVLLRYCQLDADSFVSDRIKSLIADGWDKYIARAYCLVKESQQRSKNKITQRTLIEVGQKIKLYDGVITMFDHLREHLQSIDPTVSLEFYLISGSFGDIFRSTPIAKHFKKMWGTELQYGESGEVEFIKQQMTNTEKTRYLFYISKGIDKENERDLVYNYQDLSADDIYIPLSQVIYIGDGASDIPCFTVINQYSGIALGVYSQDRSAEEWEYLKKVNSSQKISNLCEANYQKDSELIQSLSLAIECIANQIALRRLNSHKQN